MNKQWALLCLTNLKVREYDHKEDLLIAVACLEDQKKPFEVFKFNIRADFYVRQEVYA